MRIRVLNCSVNILNTPYKIKNAPDIVIFGTSFLERKYNIKNNIGPSRIAWYICEGCLVNCKGSLQKLFPKAHLLACPIARLLKNFQFLQYLIPMENQERYDLKIQRKRYYVFYKNKKRYYDS